MTPQNNPTPSIKTNCLPQEMREDRFIRMLERLPVAFDWVKFKGEIVVAAINYEATVKAGKPMVDISYCLTKAMNGIVIKTVQWDKNKFELHPFKNKNHVIKRRLSVDRRSKEPKRGVAA